jgi:hypothetical protein
MSGTVRDVQVLLTGLSTQRASDDIVAIPTVHFIKDGNGELSSIAVDENTAIELLDDSVPRSGEPPADGDGPPSA